MKANRLVQILAAVGGAILLSACGGGSGSDSDSTVEESPSEQVIEESPPEPVILKTDPNYIYCFESGTSVLETIGMLGGTDDATQIQELLGSVITGGKVNGNVTNDAVCQAGLDDALAQLTR